MRTEKEIDDKIKLFESKEYVDMCDHEWFAEAVIGVLKWVKGEKMTYLVETEK